MTKSEGSVDARPSRLDRDNYIPGYLVRLANAMSRGGSRVYRELFGVGIIEWRILSMLAIEPGLLAQAICDALELDKAAASRSVRRLEELHLVRLQTHATMSRSRRLFLTEAGWAIHERVLALVLERERLLLAGLTLDETSSLVTLLRRLVDNLGAVEAYEVDLIAGNTRPPEHASPS